MSLPGQNDDHYIVQSSAVQQLVRTVDGWDLVRGAESGALSMLSRLALSETADLLRCGNTSVRTCLHLQPFPEAHYLRIASWDCTRAAGVVRVSGAPAHSRSRAVLAAQHQGYHPNTRQAGQPCRGCLRWQSAGLAGPIPDGTRGDFISETFRLSSSTAVGPTEQDRPARLDRQADRLHVGPAGIASLSRLPTLDRCCRGDSLHNEGMAISPG